MQFQLQLKCPILELSQQQILAMQNSQIMALPTPVLKNLINDITQHPEKYEKRTLEETVGNTRENARTACFFPFQEEGALPNQKGKHGGIVASIPAKNAGLADIPDEIAIPVDGIYVSRMPNNPEFLVSTNMETFAPRMLLAQIGAEHPNAKRLCSYLMKEHNWATTKRLEIYRRIGSRQKEFIDSFDPRLFNPYNFGRIGEDVNLHESTIGRLISQRFVAIRKDEKDYFLPTKELCPSADKLKLCLSSPELNRILEEELESGRALSDREIREAMNGNPIARRTISKYRGANKIPGKPERQRAYTARDRTAPYRIELGFEKWLSNR